MKLYELFTTYHLSIASLWDYYGVKINLSNAYYLYFILFHSFKSILRIRILKMYFSGTLHSLPTNRRQKYILFFLHKTPVSLYLDSWPRHVLIKIKYLQNPKMHASTLSSSFCRNNDRPYNEVRLVDLVRANNHRWLRVIILVW